MSSTMVCLRVRDGSGWVDWNGDFWWIVLVIYSRLEGEPFFQKGGRGGGGKKCHGEDPDLG